MKIVRISLMLRNRWFSGALAVIAVVAFASNATADTSRGDGAAQGGKYCSVLVGKAPAGEVSPVLAETCSTVSMEQAQADLNAEHRASLQATGRAPLPLIPIMYWYEDVNYNNYAPTPGPGYDMTTINAADPCDSAGYRVEPSAYWKGIMSSIAGNNSCYVARVSNTALTSATNFNIHVGGSGHWLGSYSDNVGLIQVHA